MRKYKLPYCGLFFYAKEGLNKYNLFSPTKELTKQEKIKTFKEVY